MSTKLTQKQMIERLTAAKIVVPELLASMAPKLEQRGISLSLAASMLLQETSGGNNVWGHDANTIFIGGKDTATGKDWGPNVTEEGYAAYKLERDRTKRAQGAGPMQLTYIPLQVIADKKGGCWKPEVNLEVGFDQLADLIRQYKSVRLGVMHYNGSGKNAEKYADRVLARAKTLQPSLG